MVNIKYSACFIIYFILLFSCAKESFYEGKDAKLQFSSDSILFDTVFTSIGTAAKRLMIYNPYSQSLKINSIALSGAQASVFVININGISATHLNDIEIKPKDSLYIFLQVFINPLGNNLPLLIKDSILFNVNNNVQYVNLEAFGQDVHILKDKTLKTQTWPADKPYLIYGDVTVDTLQTLTIEKGAVVYFHRNANLQVKGTLTASGEFAAPILFNTDRLDKDYDDIPGQWGGILLLPGSKNHVLNWVIMKNGTSGLTLGAYNDNSKPDLVLSNTIINNMSYNCLIAINSKIKAWNCQLTDAANYTCGLIGGGDYQFYHCTIANYFSKYADRSFNIPALYISDYYNDPINYSNIITNLITGVNFVNTIVYGNNSNEFSLDFKQTSPSAYLFNHCLLLSSDTAGLNSTHSFTSIVWNQKPQFKNIEKYVFELDTLSPAKDKGDKPAGLIYPFDLKMVDRTKDNGPDIGAYERVEKQ